MLHSLPPAHLCFLPYHPTLHPSCSRWLGPERSTGNCHGRPRRCVLGLQQIALQWLCVFCPCPSAQLSAACRHAISCSVRASFLCSYRALGSIPTRFLGVCVSLFLFSLYIAPRSTHTSVVCVLFSIVPAQQHAHTIPRRVLLSVLLALTYLPSPALTLTGLAGAVKVWDTRQPDEPVADMSPEDPASARDCWAVSFGECRGKRKAASGILASASIFNPVVAY